MNPTHIIHGSPSAFEKAANEIIASSDVATSLRSLSYHDGRLAGIIERVPRSPSASGALLSVSVKEVKANNVDAHVRDLSADNPCWSIHSVFPSRESAAKGEAAPKGKGGSGAVIIVAVLTQP